MASTESVTVITLSGDVDVASQDRLRIAARWAADCNLPVRVDVSAATLLDSSGLELFTRLLRVERQRGRSITIVGAPPRIRTTLNVAGLDGLVIFEDPPD